MLPIRNRKSPVRLTNLIVLPKLASSSFTHHHKQVTQHNTLRLWVNVPFLNGNHSTLNRADRRLRASTSSW